MPGGFGEKFYVHSTVPGGVAQATERVNAVVAEANRIAEIANDRELTEV